MQNNVTYATALIVQINFKNVRCNINYFFTINIMVYYGFNRVQNNISHPHIGGSRLVFWYFTDIYMHMSVQVTSTTNFSHTHTLSIH